MKFYISLANSVAAFRLILFMLQIATPANTKQPTSHYSSVINYYFCSIDTKKNEYLCTWKFQLVGRIKVRIDDRNYWHVNVFHVSIVD